MLAYVLDRYGGPDSAQLRDVPVGTPGPGEILVRVRAAGLNPIDNKFREGKFRATLKVPLPIVLGNEFAGEVIAAGTGVRKFQVGDRVFARVGMARLGAFAQQACVEESNAA